MSPEHHVAVLSRLRSTSLSGSLVILSGRREQQVQVLGKVHGLSNDQYYNDLDSPLVLLSAQSLILAY